MGNMDDNQELQDETESRKGYALSGKIMLCSTLVLFAVIVLLFGLHLYAKWYLIRLRRGRIERRRRRLISLSELALYMDGRDPSSTVESGLDVAVLNSLPVFLYSSKSEQPRLDCAVCLSEFEEREVVRHLPKCNHSFHVECIDMWFRSHSTCPLCRSLVERVISVPRVKEIQQVETPDAQEKGSSFGSGPCQQEEGTEFGSTTSLGVRRKGLDMAGMRIEVPPRRTELSQNSPGSRMLSIKRILSMGRKSTAAGGQVTPCGAGTSLGGTELDLESGLSESSRVPTPM
ncbi:Anaphase-promoting complex (APC), subunit 11 [Handroanthus impetiginosus]|uniref:RING-type E3 ubiquitin transferase n=1 Tax=Handroanthus impetiginosus TaxID=429701 RepID=A0A2G9GHA0_9LAMI|nr:Anaphase-promoting complex (APC), subunit 11 [Handroanthus impetiginosus]